MNINLYEIIKSKANEFNNKAALVFNSKHMKSKEYLYGQVMDECDKFCRKLKKLGITKDDRVTIVAENSPQWVIAFLAIIKLEAIAVLIDPVLIGTEINRLINVSNSKVVFTSACAADKLKEISDVNYPVLNLFDDGNFFSWSKKVIDNSRIYEKLDEKGVLVIIFSSGTTSGAKGVMISHSAIDIMINECLKIYKFCPDDRFLKVIPMYHIYGFTGLMCSLYCGGTICFIESLSNQILSNAFIDFKPTVFLCVPKVYEMFRQKIRNTVDSKSMIIKKIFNTMLVFNTFLNRTTHINLGKKMFKTIHDSFGGEIRFFGSAGMTLDKKTSLFFENLGFKIFTAYGITETLIPVTANDFKNNIHGTNGKLFPGVQIKLTNINDEGLGEILIKSPGMMTGYYNDPEATQNAYDNSGWFKSGDIGGFDKKKNLFIAGRTKETIILSNGKKASPDDIESMYSDLDGVLELVVCGVPAKSSYYDEIHAFIVKCTTKDTKERDIEILIKRIASSLPNHFRIAKIHFVEMIPRTSIQKPKRYLLKQMVLGT